MAILCVGQLVGDVVIRPVDSMPVPGRTDLVQELQLVAGGCAANTASVLTKLGASASVVGLIGRDAIGDALLADLAAVGVDVTRVIRSPEVATSAVLVMVSRSGERSFLYRTGGNELLSCEAVPDAALLEARYVHVGGAMKLASLDLAALLARAREHGCITSLDTDWDVSGEWSRTLDTALPFVDFLLTNHEEGSMLTGIEDPAKMGKLLQSKGPKVVVVKLGNRGAMAFSGGSVHTCPAFTVPVLDTTCAGDSFVAGFIFAVSQGRPVTDALRLANAAGALCTTQISHLGVASYSSVQDLMLNGRHELEPARNSD